MLVCILLSFLITFSEARHFPYIIGGEDVEPPGKWPFMVSIWNNSPFGSHFCGASLVSSTWIVTAAHCMDGATPGGILALLGAHDFDNANIGEPVFYSVKNIIMHERFNPASLINDIALIELDDAVEMNEYTDIIEMADEDDGDFAFEQDCFIIGWGGDQFPGGSSYPSILQEAQAPATSNSNCEAYHPDVNDGQICVGVPNEIGACYGDSGGPLVCNGANGEYVLAGATSFGPPYCPPVKPTVYTRVSYFRDWIRTNSGV